MNRMINKFAGFIGRNTLTKLAAAVLGVCVLAPVAQAHDHDSVTVDVHNDDVGFGLAIGGHDHHDVHNDRVWVDAVWRNDGGRVWVEPVWVKTGSRVWVPPVTQDAVAKVWVDSVYQDQEQVSWSHGHRVVVHVQVEVTPGHYEKQHTTVVVAPGHWEGQDTWALKSDGHWEGHDNWVLVSDGHYEDRVVHEVPDHHDHSDHLDIHIGGH